MNKKAIGLMVSVIIILVIAAGTLVIVAMVSSQVFAGVSVLKAFQDPCQPIRSLQESIHSACLYNLKSSIQLRLPSQPEEFEIIAIPDPENENESAGYNPYINPLYLPKIRLRIFVPK